MMRFKRIAGGTVGAGALVLALTGALAAQDNPVFPLNGGTLLSPAAPIAASTDVYVAFLQSAAAFSDNVYFWAVSGGTSQYLFNGHTASYGDVIKLNPALLTTGQPLYFQLIATSVPGLSCNNTTDAAVCTWWNGDNTNPSYANVDGQIHVENATYACTTNCTWHLLNAGGGPISADGFNMQMGFEDIIIGQGGYAGDPYKDYNDVILAVQGVGGANAVPEPISLLLIGTGLLGVGAVRRRRRKADA